MRQQAGEHGGVRSQGPGTGGNGILEQNAAAGQPVKVRRGGARIAVGRKMIGPHGIQNNEDNVWPRGGFVAAARRTWWEWPPEEIPDATQANDARRYKPPGQETHHGEADAAGDARYGFPQKISAR